MSMVFQMLVIHPFRMSRLKVVAVLCAVDMNMHAFAVLCGSPQAVDDEKAHPARRKKAWITARTKWRRYSLNIVSSASVHTFSFALNGSLLSYGRSAYWYAFTQPTLWWHFSHNSDHNHWISVCWRYDDKVFLDWYPLIICLNCLPPPGCQSTSSLKRVLSVVLLTSRMNSIRPAYPARLDTIYGIPPRWYCFPLTPLQNQKYHGQISNRHWMRIQENHPGNNSIHWVKQIAPAIGRLTKCQNLIYSTIIAGWGWRQV